MGDTIAAKKPHIMYFQVTPDFEGLIDRCRRFYGLNRTAFIRLALREKCMRDLREEKELHGDNGDGKGKS